MKQLSAAILALFLVTVVGCDTGTKRTETPAGPTEEKKTEPEPGATGLDIRAISASKNPVLKGETATIVIDVINPAGADLTYSWTAEGGTIGGNQAQATWTAPLTYGVYKVNVLINASNGETTGEFIKMRVEPAILATGTKNIPDDHYWDLESGADPVDPDAASDVRWRGTIPDGRTKIVAINSALTGKVGGARFNATDYQDVKGAATGSAVIFDLQPGQVIAVRTNEGHYGKIKIVLAPNPGTLVADYLLWDL